MGEPWREVGDRVFVRRHVSMDLNVGLVVGDDACLVVDTRCSYEEGRDLVAAVRTVTSTPWSVVTTHAHFDHSFGTAALLPAAVWAHGGCAEAITSGGEADRDRMARLYEQDGQDEAAAQIRDTPLVVPDHVVHEQHALSVGGRRVELRHVGRGHTDHDIVVVLPDDGVVLAGDLVEEGAPPQFHDAFPLDWPASLGTLLATTSAAVVVPGHGDVVDRTFVAGQRELLADLVRRSAEGRAAGADVHAVAAELPELGELAVQAVERTFWQLAREDGARRARPAPGRR